MNNNEEGWTDIAIPILRLQHHLETAVVRRELGRRRGEDSGATGGEPGC
jgi:hypothetical protein